MDIEKYGQPERSTIHSHTHPHLLGDSAVTRPGPMPATLRNRQHHTEVAARPQPHTTTPHHKVVVTGDPHNKVGGDPHHHEHHRHEHHHGHPHDDHYLASRAHRHVHKGIGGSRGTRHKPKTKPSQTTRTPPPPPGHPQDPTRPQKPPGDHCLRRTEGEDG